MTTPACALCVEDGGEILFSTSQWRIVLVDNAQHPGFCRVIWNDHVSEMTDLVPEDRSELMRTVCQVEAIMRNTLQADKINLASLGNVVPHLHWHVIARYADDAQFPSPIWAEAMRVTAPEVLEARKAQLPRLREAMTQFFSNIQA